MSLAILGEILFGIKLSGRGYPSFTVKNVVGRGIATAGDGVDAM